MKDYLITDNAAGQRLDRYLSKLFPNAEKNLLQKSIRKKNITLNRKKAQSDTVLKSGDMVTIFFSDETIRKFSEVQPQSRQKIPESILAVFTAPIYEDDNLLVINKPAGLLTQPDASGKLSVSDCISELIPKEGTFHPAPANRLDLNTGGIILIPKNYGMQKKISAAIRNRTVTKEYLALVMGEIKTPAELIHYLKKNRQKNQVAISHNHDDLIAKLKIKPLICKNNTTLVSVRLETGRSHQIRVQLAADGHPIAGDPKYGDDVFNLMLRERFDLRHQLLHSYHYAIEDLGLDFTAPLPEDFSNILRALSYPEV